MQKNINDKPTADAFADSWNNLPLGSVYDEYQFKDLIEPMTKKDIEGKRVLEMGCGNASLMMMIANWSPELLVGVDLGDSVKSAEKNMKMISYKNWKIEQSDLTEYTSNGFDFVYCIGVLHHLKDPKKGFDAVVSNTNSGGGFHCWVYAYEGNAIIRYIVDPIRKVSCKLPWWITKYFIATPLVVPYYFYAKFLKRFNQVSLFKKLPLYQYSQWIAKREFLFFRHVAFDQLVTPQTTYIKKTTIQKWLNDNSEIKNDSIYIIMRNGNSWKFGGKKK
ncbi:hypothetical protein C0583_03785 [Candidatus Parcubacteria bacterium]|nr:MAG: hypothetical protein C0583_03785 [Candidatus Parcubacteria bacterium]